MNRLRFQFSLRSLLIFTMLVAIAARQLAQRMERRNREEEIVKAALLQPGVELPCAGPPRVCYAFEHFEPVGDWQSWPPPGPAWLRAFVGDYFFTEIFAMTVNHVSPEMETLPELTRLYVVHPNDADLARLKRFTHLEILEIEGREIGGDEKGITTAAVADLHRALPRCTINLNRTYRSVKFEPGDH
jgi:hypothetical protein